MAGWRIRNAASGALRRYLSCIRYREILLLQGSPLLGAAFSLPNASAGRLLSLSIFVCASVLLVAHIFVFNDWAGMEGDLNDANRAAGVFAAKGIRREAIGTLWLALLALSVALFGFLGVRPLAIALAIAACSFVYSLPGSPAKGIPILGSAIHLGGGMLHFLLGYSLFRAIDGRGIALASLFGLAFAAGHLNQEVRDIEADSRNRIKTNAVAFGERTTFLAGLALFTLAYAQLAILAAAGVIPGWLGLLALLYPLHLYWSWKTLSAGLSFESIRSFQTRYRALFAVIGASMGAAMLA